MLTNERRKVNSSSSDSVAEVYTSTVRVDAVSVNPKAKRHIGIGKQVDDEVKVITPNGPLYWVIEAIKYSPF